MSPAAEGPSSRRFSLFHLLLVVPWVALVIDAFAPIRDNSFLWHVRAGELQAHAAEVLTTDPFSFVVGGEPWRTQSWLAELFYHWGASTTGFGYIPAMMLACSTITFLGIGLIAYRRSKSVGVTAVVLLLSTMLLLSFLVPRPVIFSYALFVMVIVAWDRPSTRWTLPLLFWVWASVHGSFVIGLAYVGLSLLAERDWRALPTAVVAGLATLITAHGLGVIQMLLDFSQAGAALELLSEWKRPELWSIVFTPFLVGAVIIIYGGSRGRIALRHAWVLVPFLMLGFGATRAVPPAWLALVPLISGSLYGAQPVRVGRFSPATAAIFASVVAVLPFLLVSRPVLDEKRFPVAAAGKLANVNTFHDDRAGGYLIWAMGPDFQVYLDDRAELYKERMVEFVDIRKGTLAWEEVFERDGIEQVLLRVDEDLVGAIQEAGWETVYEDPEYVVLRP